MTVAAVALDDPVTAEREMDRAFAALLRYRRPIYLEIPRDMVHVPLATQTHSMSQESEDTDPAALKEAIAEVRSMLQAAKQPVILAGAEIGRFGLHDDLTKLVERLNVPIASTLLGKSVIREDHPLYVGVYSGLVARDEVKEFINQTDCLVILGSILSDVEDLDARASPFSDGHVVHATADRIAVKHHRYDTIRFEDFVKGLAAADLPIFASRTLPVAEPLHEPLPPLYAPVTLRAVFQHLDSVLDNQTLVIADVGESLFASVDLHVHRRFEFLSPAYYTSMGFAVPAAVGAGFADPSLRPIVLVGDGAFQMTGTELSTSVRFGHAPVIIVLNNRGYSTEREILEGPFNDIHEWRYERITELVGGGLGFRIATYGEFAQALSKALSDKSQPYILNVLLDPADRSPAMSRLAHRLAKRLSTDRP
jgi:indolepyruvate decarboxylase